MSPEIGGVCVGVGIIFLLGALFQPRKYGTGMRGSFYRWVASELGVNGARILFTIGGLGLILIGLIIVSRSS